MIKAGSWRFRAMLVAGLTVLVAATTSAHAKQLSDKSVKTFMDYAWSLVPAQFTPPNGKTIRIDKGNKAAVMVPMDVAREVIRVGRLSAHAQVCDLKASQVANYRSLMRREQLKKSWSDQQMVYISQLHLTTVMLLTGKIKLVEKDGNKEVVVAENVAKKQTCTAEQRRKVDDIIAAYVKAGPNPPKAEPAPAKKP